MSASSREPEPTTGRDWLLVDATDPMYGDAVVAALTSIFATASGRAMLRLLNTSGRVLRIERPDPTEPPNAWIRPIEAAARTNLVIAFDPADWPSPAHPGSPASDVMLFALLGEACRRSEAGAASAAEPDRTRPVYEAAEVAAYRSERGNV